MPEAECIAAASSILGQSAVIQVWYLKGASPVSQVSYQFSQLAPDPTNLMNRPLLHHLQKAVS